MFPSVELVLDELILGQVQVRIFSAKNVCLTPAKSEVFYLRNEHTCGA